MNQELNLKLARIVSMLIPAAMKLENISEPESAYFLSPNYEHRLRLSTDVK